MGQVFLNIFKTARPRQVIKNLTLFTAILFNGWLFLPDKFWLVTKAVLIFSLLTAAVYIFNDLVDVDKDRLHPLKKKRPIAAGLLNPSIAIFTSSVLLLISLSMAYKLRVLFFLLCLVYFLLHLAYTLFLKHFPIVDVLTISSGFIIRIFAGAVVANAHINVWLLLCVISFSLFLAIGKRRSELTLLSQTRAGKHRHVLFSYPEKLLDSYVSMFANTTWLTYALFTFMYPIKNIKSNTIVGLIAFLPRTFTLQKWLMITVPIVIFGVMRYLWIIYQKGKGESPEKILLSDKQLLGTVLIWIFAVIIIIYGVG